MAGSPDSHATKRFINGDRMRLTESEFKALGRPMTPAECRDNPIKKRGQKYSNQRIVDKDGQKFDSKAEMKFWFHLVIRQKAKEISGLSRQVSYELIPAQKRPDGGIERACNYVADFVYQENGKTVVADTKGPVTPVWIMKRKLMLFVHGIQVKEIRC